MRLPGIADSLPSQQTRQIDTRSIAAGRPLDRMASASAPRLPRGATRTTSAATADLLQSTGDKARQPGAERSIRQVAARHSRALQSLDGTKSQAAAARPSPGTPAKIAVA